MALAITETWPSGTRWAAHTALALLGPVITWNIQASLGSPTATASAAPA
eukprot:CAMPEP_0117678832 /NCGR_PEP_ID=MMETSP0804-20121206/17504_1 /TAXON_ID=1074897 /ORGANISM="Tetraselmis astigmatica, Strain CCMP880" /LENGTH=48 /DNA_ID= /DNA_START= /DNA_END= /DNA_ORIENTATION=